MSQAVISTARLLLRPLTLADAPRIADLVGGLEVARMLSRVPHPYTLADALGWIASQASAESRARQPVFAGEREGALIGLVSYQVADDRRAAEIGYWLGKPYWGNGYATEMARALIRHGVVSANLPRFTTSHFIDNLASARVIAKCGFKLTGRRKLPCPARDSEVTALTYALTRAEAEAQTWFVAA